MESVNSNPRMKTKMCGYFLRGNCAFGDRCAFAHDARELRALPSERVVCVRWLLGKCNFGHTCPDLHISETASTNAPSSASLNMAGNNGVNPHAPAFVPRFSVDSSSSQSVSAKIMPNINSIAADGNSANHSINVCNSNNDNNICNNNNNNNKNSTTTPMNSSSHHHHNPARSLQTPEAFGFYSHQISQQQNFSSPCYNHQPSTTPSTNCMMLTPPQSARVSEFQLNMRAMPSLASHESNFAAFPRTSLKDSVDSINVMSDGFQPLILHDHSLSDALFGEEIFFMPGSSHQNINHHQNISYPSEANNNLNTNIPSNNSNNNNFNEAHHFLNYNSSTNVLDNSNCNMHINNNNYNVNNNNISLSNLSNNINNSNHAIHFQSINHHHQYSRNHAASNQQFIF